MYQFYLCSSLKTVFRVSWWVTKPLRPVFQKWKPIKPTLGKESFWVFIVLLVAFIPPAVLANEENYTHSFRRARPDPMNIPIRVLKRRSPADNTTFGAGVSQLSFASDRQSYFAVIKVGGINFRVALDTASSDLWLASSSCETETCKEIPRYPLSYQSPTFITLNDNSTAFRASYADGTFASGFVARETLELANITLANQTFGVVTESNVTLTDETTGIMGLGFPRLSSITDVGALPFFSTLAAKGLLEYPLFGLSLTRNSSGSLTMGAIDASVVHNVSNIGWNKVAQFPPFAAENNISSYLQWAIPITGVAFNGTQISPIATYANVGRTQSLALIDVGAPGIYGPYQDVSRVYSMIDGARLVDSTGQWAIPCDTTESLSFTFGLRNYTLLPTDYLIGPADGNPNLCLSWPMALPPSSDGIDWQMGAAFLRTVYSVFSYGINRKEPPLIGFYSLSNTTNTTTTQPPDSILSFLSANTATVATTLPNFLLPTPSFTTPPLALNTSVSASVGGLVSSGLANATYSALFAQRTSLTNVSALPRITPSASVITLVVTGSAGDVSTTVSTASLAAVTLGLPPGWSAGSSLTTPVVGTMVLPCILVIWTLLSSWH
ncbi:unnamed protein product [Cyclocybe aegerita]|uniref:Peptidase A1 domain-containing protein n=1 Tax=Cyclocybe aegerita TaxID=1973307 RepID=A0A8S0VYF4_CYCAE|nr:unnamed protein product [Cyclocybe aegerita]